MIECKSCGIPKPSSEFLKTNKSTCKACIKIREKAREAEKRKDPKYVEKQRARGREKYRRLGYKDKYKTKYATTVSYRVNHPHKYKAQVAAQRVPCPQGLVRHHWSYNPEHYKDVIILEPEDHYLVHTSIRYDEESLMYFSKENKLLKTKRLHMNYIKRILEENGTNDRTYAVGYRPVAQILPRLERSS